MLNGLPTPEVSAPTLNFPQSLADKYLPKRVDDFVGLQGPKTVLSKFVANPTHQPSCSSGHRAPVRPPWRSLWPSRSQQNYGTFLPASVTSIPSRMSPTTAISSRGKAKRCTWF